jgi:hypothetical protein
MESIARLTIDGSRPLGFTLVYEGEVEPAWVDDPDCQLRRRIVDAAFKADIIDVARSRDGRSEFVFSTPNRLAPQDDDGQLLPPEEPPRIIVAIPPDDAGWLAKARHEGWQEIQDRYQSYVSGPRRFSLGDDAGPVRISRSRR